MRCQGAWDKHCSGNAWTNQKGLDKPEGLTVGLTVALSLMWGLNTPYQIPIMGGWPDLVQDARGAPRVVWLSHEAACLGHGKHMGGSLSNAHSGWCEVPHVWCGLDIPETSLSPNRPKPYQNHGKTRPKPCQNHGKASPKPCQKHCKNRPKPRQNHGKTRPKQCQEHTLGFFEFRGRSYHTL